MSESPRTRYTADNVARALNHDGTLHGPNERFFNLPDTSIGELLSASTSHCARRPKRDWGFTGFVAFVGGVVATIGLMLLIGHPQADLWALLVLVVCTVIAGWFLGPEASCSYVGTKAAWFVTRPLRVFVHRRVLDYKRASDVKTQWTRVFNERGYAGTWVEFVWIDDRDKPVFRLKTTVNEFRIDRDEIDLSRLRELPPYYPASAAYAALDAFQEFQELVARENAEQ
jgi:hypothetical protein